MYTVIICREEDDELIVISNPFSCFASEEEAYDDVDEQLEFDEENVELKWEYYVCEV